MTTVVNLGSMYLRWIESIQRLKMDGEAGLDILRPTFPSFLFRMRGEYKYSTSISRFPVTCYIFKNGLHNPIPRRTAEALHRQRHQRFTQTSRNP